MGEKSAEAFFAYLRDKYSTPVPPEAPKPLFTVTIDQKTAMSKEELDLDYLNLNDIADSATTIEVAEYHVRITEAEVRESKPPKKGKYVNYKVTIQSGPHAGVSLYGIWSLLPEWVYMMKKDFNKMGYAPPNGVPRLDDLRGFEGIVKIGERVRKDPETKQPDPELGKENYIKSWVGKIQ